MSDMTLTDDPKVCLYGSLNDQDPLFRVVLLPPCGNGPCVTIGDSNLLEENRCSNIMECSFPYFQVRISAFPKYLSPFLIARKNDRNTISDLSSFICLVLTSSNQDCHFSSESYNVCRMIRVGTLETILYSFNTVKRKQV